MRNSTKGFIGIGVVVGLPLFLGLSVRMANYASERDVPSETLDAPPYEAPADQTVRGPTLQPSNSRARETPEQSRIGLSRDQQIEALKELDPSSYGYTDADRAFLKKHGVSEAEARAAETILKQHGIE